MASTRSSGSDKTLTSEPVNHEIQLDSQFSRAYSNGRDDKLFYTRGAFLPQRLDTHPVGHVDSGTNHLDPTTLAQKVLSETVQQRQALEIMQGESLRNLKQKQQIREQMEDAESVQSELTSHVTEMPPPLPSEPPPQLDEQECSTPTSTSSHFTLPPHPTSSLPYAVSTTSHKPVASVLPSVYSGTRSFSNTKDSAETSKRHFMPDDQKSGKDELKSKPPLPLKPKTVTFSDDVRSNSSKNDEDSPPSSSSMGNKMSNTDEFVKNSVKKLTSQFEQQSVSNLHPAGRVNSPAERTLNATQIVPPRGVPTPTAVPRTQGGARVASATHPSDILGRK